MQSLEQLSRALKPLKPNLVIQTRQGDPIPEKLDLELVEYSLTQPEPVIEAATDQEILRDWRRKMAGSDQAAEPVPEEEMERLRQASRARALKAEDRARRLGEWAGELSRLFWIRLQVANLGPVPARDVRVRIAVSPSEFVAFGPLNGFSAYNPSIGITDDQKADGIGSVLTVSDSEAEETVFLHTLVSVGVERTELLWAMGFLSSGDLVAGHIVSVSVSIDEESGVRTDGHFQMRLFKGATWFGDGSAIRDHADSSRAMLKKQ